MSAKQDKVAARTAADLERKFKFGKSFAEAMGIATDARDTAEGAQESANDSYSQIVKLAESITLKVTGGEAGNTASIVLTVGDKEYTGEINLTGLVTFESLQESGETQINGANLVTGAIRSKDGTVELDLDHNRLTIAASATNKLVMDSNSLCGYGINGTTNEFERVLEYQPGRYIGPGHIMASAIRAAAGVPLVLSSGDGYINLTGTIKINGKEVGWNPNEDGTFTLIGIGE